MTPDAEFEQNRQETESAQLAKMVEKLSDSDKTEIYQKGRQVMHACGLNKLVYKSALQYIAHYIPLF